jgi:hypothetical protein
MSETFAEQEPGAAAQNIDYNLERQRIDREHADALDALNREHLGATAEVQQANAQKVAEVTAAHEAAKADLARKAMTPEDRARLEAEEKDQEARNAEVQKTAEFNAHPHTQISKLLADLRAPGVLDINARVSLALQGISRLAQLVLTHTPPPEKNAHGESIERSEQSAQGTDEQVGIRAG